MADAFSDSERNYIIYEIISQVLVGAIYCFRPYLEEARAVRVGAILGEAPLCDTVEKK